MISSSLWSSRGYHQVGKIFSVSEEMSRAKMLELGERLAVPGDIGHFAVAVERSA